MGDVIEGVPAEESVQVGDVLVWVNYDAAYGRGDMVALAHDGDPQSGRPVAGMAAKVEADPVTGVWLVDVQRRASVILGPVDFDTPDGMYIVGLS